MKIEKVNINDLISPDYNPREISDEEMQKLKTSITEFGYVDPIIVNDVNQHIVGGNQRYFALKELEYTEVDVVYIHEEDSNREKALNIALNKISGEWDINKLQEILSEMEEEGFDIELTGFDNLELKDIELYEEDYGKDEFDNLVEEYEIKEESNKDENWLYVEFYGDDERYNEITQLLSEYIVEGKHEISSDWFYNFVKNNI